MDAHARHLRDHVDRLAGKAYWAALSPSPEFVILFIPGEAFLAPALERDPGLLEYALGHKVHIATPTTLVTMLRTAQYAWQQEALSENARAVFDLGRELYDRLSGLGKHVDRLGHALTKAVSTYNQAVGSLESRVLVSARRLNDLGLVEGDIASPALVEETARALSAPELVASRPAEIGPAEGWAAGFQPSGVGAAGFEPTDMRAAGFEPAGLESADMRAADFEPAGLESADMRAEGFEPSNMGAADIGRRADLVRAAR
jgi:DNA recombination protein RmuC